MRKLIAWVCVWMAALLLFAGGDASGRQSVQVTYDDDEVILQVWLPEGVDYRVWHTNNPMKVIVDVDAVLDMGRRHQTFADVALQACRVSPDAAAGSTRVVLDFAYQLPPPVWEESAGLLTVVTSKRFVRSSIVAVSQGVRYGHERRGIPAGPLIINYLEIDIADPDVQLKAVLAQDKVLGTEHVSSMAQRSQAIAAVNGLFFASDGRPLGLLAIDGRLVTEPLFRRTAIGLGRGFAVMDQVGLQGQVLRVNGERGQLSGLNSPRGADQLVLYTPDFGTTTQTNRYGIDVVIEEGIVTQISAGDTFIPDNGVVLSGHGVGARFLEDVRLGERLYVDFGLDVNWLDQGVREIIGGGPRLVQDGQVNITGEAERFQPDVLSSRAPRTALGLTDEQKLLLVTVNGRQPGISVGMTLEELAKLMIDLGAVDAMNLDGGGSTTMVIRHRVLNLPSDGVERPVSNALVVTTPESRR